MAQKSVEMVQYLAKQKPKKLFNILNKLERFGVGRRVTRTIYRQEETGPDAVAPCYWTITRVKPDKVVTTLLRMCVLDSVNVCECV